MRDRHSTTSSFAWHGWQLSLPRSWNPVKIEGDALQGSVLFADLDHPRLGQRWRKAAGRKFDPARWAQRAMRDEVGQLAAKEAKSFTSPVTSESSLLYLDDNPPGRDVWVGYSSKTARVIEIIYHARRRDRVLAETILPALHESSPEAPTPWSIFDLTCQTPPGFHLATHRLMAGDLALNFFSRQRERLTVRQIAVAELALSRMSLSEWLANQQQALLPHFCPRGSLREIKLTISGRKLDGFARDAEKLKRFMFHRWLPQKITTLALHDPELDRLLLFGGTDPTSIETFAATVGTVMQNRETPDERK
jgi:hypothetical protein